MPERKEYDRGSPFNPIKVLFLLIDASAGNVKPSYFQSYQGSIFTRQWQDKVQQRRNPFNPIKVLFLR